jgi:glycosyltransferase involved in cell wall biosynthesis
MQRLDPPRSGAAIRAVEIVRGLSAHGFDVNVISPDAPGALDWLGVDHSSFGLDLGLSRRLARKARALRIGMPGAWSPALNPQFARELRRAVGDSRRLIVAGAPAMGNLPRVVWPQVIVDSHNLELIRAGRVAAAQGAGGDVHYRRARRFEIDVIRRAGGFLVCSEFEAASIPREVRMGSVHVVPNGAPALRQLPVPDAPTAYFIGLLDYKPNSDGLLWLLKHVWPSVRRQVPEANLLVAGRGDPDPALSELLRESTRHGVDFRGEVADASLIAEEARVCLVPILSGGGTRLKILEAAAFGRPVVTTTIGCEGLDLPPAIRSRDDAADFAAAVVEGLMSGAAVASQSQALAHWVAPLTWDAVIERDLVPLLTAVDAEPRLKTPFRHPHAAGHLLHR